MPSSLSYTLSLHDALPIFPARSRILDHRTEVVAAEVVRQLQPEPGELHADAGLEAAALDVGEDVLVGADDRRRLLLGRDLLAEHVDRRDLSLRVELADGLSRVLQLGPGDVARGELLHHGPRDGGQ